MEYCIFKFGAIYLDGILQPNPLKPRWRGDIPKYYGKSNISIGTANKKGITWVKPNGLNLLVADRVLLTCMRWDDLERNGFVQGKKITVDGQKYLCRLPQIGKVKGVSNEWDQILDITGEKDSLWHWDTMYFWGADYSGSARNVRGWQSARYFHYHSDTYKNSTIGFRPILEPMCVDNPSTNCKLDGVDFQLSSIPGGVGFCPMLQPIQMDVFKDIPSGKQIRMYTILANGKPIRIGDGVKKSAKLTLTLTDRYFGDEYLVPWIITNGLAVASQLL